MNNASFIDVDNLGDGEGRPAASNDICARNNLRGVQGAVDECPRDASVVLLVPVDVDVHRGAHRSTWY
jgi:hypothetical protein